MTSVQNVEKTNQELWNDYFFLTKEMDKFLDQQNMDIFYELLEQRETLQNIIERQQDDEFQLSPQGQELLGRIQKINQNIGLKFQHAVNNSRNQHNISRAYDGLGADPVANRRDWHT